MKHRSLRKKNAGKNLLTVFFGVISILYVFPVFMVLLNSFKKNTFVKTETFSWPTAESFAGLDNFIKGLTFGNYPFLKSALFSLVITLLSTALILLFTSMAAWYIARVDSLFCRIVYFACVFSMVVPFQMVMFTLSKTADTLKLNTPWTIPIIYLGFGAGLAVFMFTGFVKSIPLDIVYEDADLVVVNKPAGMVVHPAAGNPDGTLVNALLAHCGETLSGIGGEMRPGIVHRIDKETSELIAVAKNDEAHLALSEQLKDKTMSRIYLAVVRGCPREQEGRIDRPIGRSPKDRKKMAIVPDGRDAATRYQVLERFDGWSLLRLELETGRTHQIRVHMASIGHPLMGDCLYSSSIIFPL